MTGGTLPERAERVLMQSLPDGFEPGDLRMETLPQDGTLILFARFPGEDDPLSLLRENAKPGKTLPAHLVIDPDTGRPARRYAIPYRVWARPETLRAALAGGDPQGGLSCSSALRLLKQVQAGVAVHRYGRGGRFTLFLDREPPVLAARVFPGGVRESGDPSLPPSCLEGVALILLARTGPGIRPYPFHLLREKDFFGVERAVHIDKVNGVETLKTLENELIRGAEEDRKIMNALLSSRVSWETLSQVQTKERGSEDV